MTDCASPSRVIAISPHPDDVALSITDTLNEIGQTRSDLRFSLVTCFGVSSYTRFPECRDSGLITEIRENEDRLYLRSLQFADAVLQPLGFHDAPLRPEWSESQSVFAVSRAELGRYVPPLQRRLMQETECSLCFLPLGLGHKDHLITSAAASAVFKQAPAIFYEDCPYLFTAELGPMEVRLADLNKTMDETLLPMRPARAFDMERWLKCVRAYESQMTPDHMQRIADAMARRGGERVWATARARAAVDKLGCPLVPA